MFVKALKPLALLLALGVAACDDQSPLAPVDLQKTVPAGAVQVVVQQQPGAAKGTATFIVRVVGNGVDVSAYQGAVTFLPGAFELVNVETPSGQDGAFFLVNPAEFAQGRVRFAAYAAEGFGETEAFRMTVKMLAPIEGSSVTAALDVVGSETGNAVDASKVLLSRGVRDAATGRLLTP